MAGKSSNTERQVLQSSKQLRPFKQASRRRYSDDLRKASGRYPSKREDFGNSHVGTNNRQNGKLNLQLFPPKTRPGKGQGGQYAYGKNEVGNQGEEPLEEEEDTELPLKDRLIQFKYERHQATTTSSCDKRRTRKIISPYYREGFLQANCNFMVKEGGSYNSQLLDPDIPVDWDSVEELCIKTCSMVSCPICLYPPAASKITRCGHVYCWSCITHYLFVDGSPYSKCPICFDSVKAEDLKSVTVLPLSKVMAGQKINMLLMKRKKGSLISMPIRKWYDNGREPLAWTDWSSCGLPKLQVASVDTVLARVIEREKSELQQQLDAATAEKSEEKVFIENVLEQLKVQEESFLLQKRNKLSGGFGMAVGETKASQKQIPRASSFPGFPSSPSSPPSFNTSGGQSFDFAPSPSSASSSSLQQEEKQQLEEFYYFYQASDGQDLYIHPINVRCLLREYGSFEQSPVEITAEVIDIATYNMNLELRKKFRYLSHLPLSCEFSICEVMLKQPVLSQDTIDEFAEQFRRQKKERERKKRQERRFERKMEAKQTLDCFGRAIIRSKEEPTHLDLNSQEDFPSYTFAREDKEIAEVKKEGAEDIREQVSPSVTSFSAALMSKKSPDRIPSRLPPSAPSQDAVCQSFELDVAAEPEDNEYTCIPTFSESFSEAISASFRDLVLEGTGDVRGEGRKGKKGRQKGKKLLFSTGLNRISQ